MHLKSEKHRTNELTQNTYNTPEASKSSKNQHKYHIQIFQNVIGPKTAKKSKNKLKSLKLNTRPVYLKELQTTRTTRQYMKKNHAHGVFLYTLAFHIDSTELKNEVICELSTCPVG